MDKTIDHRLAWLAGIIDGEGSISLYRRRLTPSAVRSAVKRGCPKASSWFGAVYIVQVSNTDDAMIAEVRALGDILGAKSSFEFKTFPKAPTHKPAWRVTFKTRKSVYAVLVAIFPYLITKRARAEVVLRAMAHRKSVGQAKRGHNSYIGVGTDAVFGHMVDEMRRLNHRGVAKEE